MKVMCIKDMNYNENSILKGVTDPIFNSIKIGDWIEVNLKSIYTKTNEDPYKNNYYFFLKGSNEYAFHKSNFITLREYNLNKLI
jgi:hypothetical protein